MWKWSQQKRTIFNDGQNVSEIRCATAVNNWNLFFVNTNDVHLTIIEIKLITSNHFATQNNTSILNWNQWINVWCIYNAELNPNQTSSKSETYEQNNGEKYKREEGQEHKITHRWRAKTNEKKRRRRRSCSSSRSRSLLLKYENTHNSGCRLHEFNPLNEITNGDKCRNKWYACSRERTNEQQKFLFPKRTLI